MASRAVTTRSRLFANTNESDVIYGTGFDGLNINAAGNVNGAPVLRTQDPTKAAQIDFWLARWLRPTTSCRWMVAHSEPGPA